MFISVRIYFQCQYIRPDEITKILGILPTSSQERGRERKLPNGKLITERMGLWVWKTGIDTDDATLNSCIKILRDTFSHVAGSFALLPNVDASWIDVHIVDSWVDAPDRDRDMSFLLTLEDIEILNTLKSPIEFTVSSIHE